MPHTVARPRFFAFLALSTIGPGYNRTMQDRNDYGSCTNRLKVMAEPKRLKLVQYVIGHRGGRNVNRRDAGRGYRENVASSRRPADGWNRDGQEARARALLLPVARTTAVSDDRILTTAAARSIFRGPK